MTAKDQRDAYPEIMTMAQAMQYLSEIYGFPCRSRKSFYELEENFDIPEIDLNPGGVKKTRRFRKSQLDEFAKNPQRFAKQNTKAKENTKKDKGEHVGGYLAKYIRQYSRPQERKDEYLGFRLSKRLHDDFVEHCDRLGLSISEALTILIERELAEAAEEALRHKK